MLETLIKLMWKDLSSGGLTAVLALLLIVLSLLLLALKKVWEAKIKSDDEVKNERERSNLLRSQLIESRDRTIERYSNDSAIVAKALGEVEKSIAHINGMLSRLH